MNLNSISEENWNHLVRCVENTSKICEEERREAYDLQVIRNNSIPLILLRDIEAVDKPTSAYKLVREQQEQEVEEKPEAASTSYIIEAVIEEGPILHSLGRVGFTVKEFFTVTDYYIKPLPTVLPTCKQGIVSVHHASYWYITEPGSQHPTPGKKYITILDSIDEHIKYRDEASAHFLTYLISPESKEDIRKARLSPLTHEIVEEENYIPIVHRLYSYLINQQANFVHLKWNNFLLNRDLKKEETSAPFPSIEKRCVFSSISTDLWDLV